MTVTFYFLPACCPAGISRYQFLHGKHVATILADGGPVQPGGLPH